MSVTNGRLLELREQFADELKQAMYQGPQWQKHPHEMMALIDELIELRIVVDRLTPIKPLASERPEPVKDERAERIAYHDQVMQMADNLMARVGAKKEST